MAKEFWECGEGEVAVELWECEVQGVQEIETRVLCSQGGEASIDYFFEEFWAGNLTEESDIWTWWARCGYSNGLSILTSAPLGACVADKVNLAKPVWGKKCHP